MLSVIGITNETSALVRDAFGFRKILVVGTNRGKVYGIDSANGEILWSRVLGLGWAAEVGGRVYPLKIFTTRTVKDGDTPQVVLITQRKASNVRVFVSHPFSRSDRSFRALSTPFYSTSTR